MYRLIIEIDFDFIAETCSYQNAEQLSEPSSIHAIPFFFFKLKNKCSRKALQVIISLNDILNPIAFRMAKTQWSPLSFGRSECNRVKSKFRQ